MKVSQFYFGFSGCITRSRFWLQFFLPAALLTYAIDFVARRGVFPKVSMTIWIIFLVWPLAAVLAKRWHDRNKSGWWTLIGPIPLVGQIWTLIECGCLPSRVPSNSVLAKRYDLTRIKADELRRLVEEMRPLHFSRSKDLSNHIMKYDLRRKYQNIAGVVRKRRDEREWDFKGGFPPDMYRIICELLWLDNQGTTARVVRFTSFKAQREQRRFW